MSNSQAGAYALARPGRRMLLEGLYEAEVTVSLQELAAIKGRVEVLPGGDPLARHIAGLHARISDEIRQFKALKAALPIPS